MAKTKINFEIDEASLSNAKAYVGRHGGSLNRLVSSLFASLGEDEQLRVPIVDPSKRVLLDLSAGRVSLMEATRLLDLPDAGYALQRLADEGLPLPRLPDDAVRRQAAQSLNALQGCLTEPGSAQAGKAGKRRTAAVK